MTPLQLSCDHGLLAGWVLARRTADHPRASVNRLAWLGPPLLRSLDYGYVIAIAALTDPDALPVCFAFLGALAFHHYDLVYRMRHQRLAPPGWVRLIGGGWDGRLLVVSALALAGLLGPGLLVATVALALAYVTESVSSWIRFVRAEEAGPYDEDDDEDGIGELE